MPISPPLSTKLKPQRSMRIYVGYDSSSIIRYLKPLIGDLFIARFTDCHFYMTVFPPLKGDKNVNVPEERRKLSWTTPILSHLDPRTAQSKTEVQCILDLQSIAQSMPDAFTDSSCKYACKGGRTKCTTDFPPGGQDVNLGDPRALAASQSFASTQKCGRPLGLKDSHPRKRKSTAQSLP
ncbi:uncharacterized protein LOC125471064 [Pyrus x bretschneideri]|uniref:uncharacterized protein LOC125471064 n=1 Tax=Pyrus x bretschneideri TaxID=225117 RepID=UPI0020309063|nr:uncharacterized protein LOC125471064 [Pyrus x bretschneideri]